jgi:hypothetical protein
MSFLFDHPLLFGSVMHGQTSQRYIELYSFTLNPLTWINHPEELTNNNWRSGFFMSKTFDQTCYASYLSGHPKNICKFLDWLEQHYAGLHYNTKKSYRDLIGWKITWEHLVFDVNKFLEIIRKVREPSVSK